MIKALLLLVALFVQALPASAAAPDYDAVFQSIAFNSNYPSGTDASNPCTKIGLGNPTAIASMEYTLVGPPNLYSSYKCRIIWKDSPPSGFLSVDARFHCPYGGTTSITYGGKCTGVPDGSGPPPENPCTAGKRVTVTYQTGTYIPPDGYTIDPAKVPNPNGASDGVCKFTIDEVKGCVGRADGKAYCTYSGVQTGDKMAPGGTGGGATPSTAPGAGAAGDTQAPVPPFTGKPGGGCPKGTVQGGVGADGVPMCMGTGSNPPPPPKAPPTTTKPPTTTTGADGTSTTTQQTSQTNSDGSTTTTTTTTVTAPDGTKTTSSQTSNSGTAGGSPGRTDNTPEQEQTNFCKQNPTLSICRESSVSGSCGQTSCTGDAIQCATLRAAAAMECKQRTDEDALKALAVHAKGQAAANGNDPDAAGLPSKANASVVNMKAMSDAGWIGGGSAFKDVSFTLQGKTIAVPLEKWSGYLVGLRYALMVVAMLVSFRMVSGVILRD